MMLTIRVDGYEIDLTSLDDVLVSTEVDSVILNQLVADFPTANPAWSDHSLLNKISERLGRSIPEHMSIEDMPTLPDQLAHLLRSELTLLASKYPLESEEKDRAEQLLQDLTRPLIYHLIERHYAGKPAAEPEAIVCRAISETIAPSWQIVKTNDWEIHLLDSLIGPIGYEFQTTDEVIYSNRGMMAEGEFFYTLATSLAKKIFGINLE